MGYLLLSGGDKSTQKRDIKRAIAMALILPKDYTMTNFTHFDTDDYLDNEETIAAYLTEVLEDPAPDMFIIAMKTVARARGMTQLAKDSGLGRESLYKALSPGAKPRYETIMKVVRALGVKLHTRLGNIFSLPNIQRSKSEYREDFFNAIRAF